MHQRLTSGARGFQLQALIRRLGAALLLMLPVSIIAPLGSQPDPRETADAVQSASIDKPTSGQQVLSKLSEYNHYKETHLRRYSVVQTYVVKNAKGRSLAEIAVRMQYRAPGVKTFTTRFARGSRLIRRLVFKPLMEQEVRKGAGRGRQASAIGPDNYAFDLLGEQHIDPSLCFVVRAIPRRRDKYLFEGQI